MKIMRLSLASLLTVLSLSACTSWYELSVAHPWARPAKVGENSAAYFVIENRSSTDDVLLGVRSEIASATEIHASMDDGNGVMSMQMQESVPVPAHEHVEFQPGSLHVMLVGLTQDLEVGQTISLVLQFEEAGEVTVQAIVK